MVEPLFKNEMLRGRPLYCIGGGSLGSRCVENACRAHFPEIYTIDPDTVEARNRFNQRFFTRDIGSKKVDALSRLVQEIGSPTTVHVGERGRMPGHVALSGIVFLMVDTMHDRKSIWKKCIKENPDISLMVEARMGYDTGRIYGVDPNNVEHIEQWEKHSEYDDAPEALVGCKADYPLPWLADLVAAHAMWRLTDWLAFEEAKISEYVNYVGFSFREKYMTEHECWL